MGSTIDHLVITAPDLASGAAYVEAVLGVPLQRGGAHPRMATHNLLLRLGDSVYLEVIAADPAAVAERPRWFALDRLAPDAPPRLATWVVRTDDVRRASRACAGVVGTVETMSRGALSWLITVTADGHLPLGGAAPAAIEWLADPHPARSLADCGCVLVELEIGHPEPERVEALLAAIAFSGPVALRNLPAGAAPELSARIMTPGGLRVLSTPRPVRTP